MGILTAPVAGRPAQAAPAIGLTTPRRRRARWVPPLMAVAVVLLTGGLWEGLVYLGLPLAAGQHSLHVDHGPLMVLGFLGTLIALERAVALGPAWSYLAPAGAAASGCSPSVQAAPPFASALARSGERPGRSRASACRAGTRGPRPASVGRGRAVMRKGRWYERQSSGSGPGPVPEASGPASAFGTS